MSLCSGPLFGRCPRALAFTWWGDDSLCPWHKPTELAHSFLISVLVSISVFMAPSTVFHSINSPEKSPCTHSVFPATFLPNWSFQLYISLLAQNTNELTKVVRPIAAPFCGIVGFCLFVVFAGPDQPLSSIWSSRIPSVPNGCPRYILDVFSWSFGTALPVTSCRQG